jgi:hypothetical protein
LSETDAALKKAIAIDNINQLREAEFSSLLPVLQRQKITYNILYSLQVLKTLRETQDFWFVLLADQKSYTAGTTCFTNGGIRLAQSTSTNAITNNDGIVVEMCIPDKGGEKLKPLNDLVADIKKHPLYSRVDSLAANQRTNLVDPKLLIPDRHFAISLEVADDGLLKPLRAQTDKTNNVASLAK